MCIRQKFTIYGVVSRKHLQFGATDRSNLIKTFSCHHEKKNAYIAQHVESVQSHSIQPISSLILQNAKFLPLATAIPHAALAAVSLAVKGVLGLFLLRGVEEQATAAQSFGVVEEDVGLVLVHFAEDDDVGWVVLRVWSVR